MSALALLPLHLFRQLRLGPDTSADVKFTIPASLHQLIASAYTSPSRRTDDHDLCVSSDESFHGRYEVRVVRHQPDRIALLFKGIGEHAHRHRNVGLFLLLPVVALLSAFLAPDRATFDATAMNGDPSLYVDSVEVGLLALTASIPVAECREVVDLDELLTWPNQSLEYGSVVEPQVALPAFAFESVVNVKAVDVDRNSLLSGHVVESRCILALRCEYTSDCLGPSGGSTDRVNGPLLGSISLFGEPPLGWSGHIGSPDPVSPQGERVTVISSLVLKPRLWSPVVRCTRCRSKAFDF